MALTRVALDELIGDNFEVCRESPFEVECPACADAQDHGEVCFLCDGRGWVPEWARDDYLNDTADEDDENIGFDEFPEEET